MAGLFDGDLLVVAGKGGVGKSVVAAALGLAASRHGLETLVVEVAGRCDAAGLLGAGPAQAGVERRVAPRLRVLTVDPSSALEDYLSGELRALGRALAHVQGLRAFLAATPGMNELLTIGKVWDLAEGRTGDGGPTVDLVVLDGPATGHALALLGAPATFAAAARVGPVAHQAGAIEQLLRDPARTGVVAVTTAEETPVNETLELRGGI